MHARFFEECGGGMRRTHVNRSVKNFGSSGPHCTNKHTRTHTCIAERLSAQRERLPAAVFEGAALWRTMPQERPAFVVVVVRVRGERRLLFP